MSAWSERNGGGSAVAGSGGSRQYGNSSGLPSGSGGVYRPPASGVSAPGVDEDVRPGSVSLNPFDPVGSVKKAADPISMLFDGLRQAVVGPNEGREAPDFEDKSLVGGIPVVGNIARAGANALGGVGEVVGKTIDAVGGAAERVPFQRNDKLQADYDALPEEFKAKFFEEHAKADPGLFGTGLGASEEKTLGDKGLFGTGILSNEDHFKSMALRAYAEDQSFEKPTLAPGKFTAPGSLADVVTNLFDTFVVSGDVAAKHFAQFDVPWDESIDRIDRIMAVGAGTREFEEDKGLFGSGVLAGDPTTGLNPLEELVYVKVSKGDWTRNEAADFLASNGQAFGHSAVANIVGSVALDPLNIATFGAGALAKLGKAGAEVVKLAETTAAARQAAESALDAAIQGRKYLRNAEKIARADKAVDAARQELRAAKAAEDEARLFRSSGEGIRGANVIGRAAEGSEKVQTFMKAAGYAYTGLEGTTLGRAAKVTRTIIDPLHALDLHAPGTARMVDLLSDSIPATVADTLGVHHYKRVLDDLTRLDPTGKLMDQIADDFGVASANLGREGVTDIYRASQVNAGLGDELMKTLPTNEDLFASAAAATKHRDVLSYLRHSTVRNVYQEVWTAADKATLARQLEQTYRLRSEADWLKYFKTATKEELSVLKFAAYGSSNRKLLNYVANMAPEVAAKMPVDPNRIVLLARGTLTRVGAESLLTKLSKMKSTKKKVAVIREWQEKYPSLRYVSIDPANPGRSVDDFVMYLDNNIEKFPMQMTADELAELGDDAADLLETTGEYSLGFRPEDRFLWGLERENGTGLYRPATQAWADHVADAAVSYRPAKALRLNILGQPLVDMPVVGKAARIVDTMDSAARVMKAQVTGAMIGEAARKRFIAKAVTGDLAEHGVTETVANHWFDRIAEYSRSHQGYSGPRGFGGDELYKAIREENLIPQPLLNGERRLNPDDIMRLVLEAYDGDIRYIGLTQKLSGRAKKYLFEATGSNWAGQIAEHVWPTMKFRYNPIFQLQEKVEPWVLNAQRGVSFATGVSMSEADRVTESLLKRMTNNSIVRQADIDQYEYSSEVLFGGLFRKTAARPGSRMNKLQQMGQAITEVQGMKRINMLRTFRKGLGKEVRAAWDEARPGEFDQMLQHAQGKAGRLLNEDDFALQLMTENLHANDILVERIGGALKAGGLKADWSNAIKTGAWHTPTTLGELKALDLDHVSASLRLTDAAGKDIKNLSELRGALAKNPDLMDNVLDGLARHGADKDYIRRVENALNFSWGGFWKTAEKRFALTADESVALQDMMAQAAKLRNMTPVEFMSQVFAPGIIDGTEGILGHVEGSVRLLREARAAGRKVKPKDARYAETRTRLAGKAGESTREDLVRQLSAAFSAHLDPSAKRALLMEFRPELRKAVLRGDSRLDLAEVQEMWDSLAENDLADRIIGYMDGKQPTHTADLIDDELRGVAPARDAARRYMQERGVNPLEGRPHFKLDADMEAHYEVGAQHYTDLPTVDYERTGRIPTAGTLQKSGLDLKPKAEGVDDRTYEAYQAFVQDTRAQYDFITRPTDKGGMGLKIVVSKTDPYQTGAKFEGRTRSAFAKHFDDLQDRVWAAEKQSDPKTWTKAQRAAYDSGDWETFSRLRGYTEAEIAEYGEYQRLMRLIDDDTLGNITDDFGGKAGVHGEDLFDMLPAKVLTEGGADSAAMRADIAKGRLKVFGGSSDHPLMTNDQNVMFRAVHDVFGHSAEGFEFGPRGELNAAATHARMYSNEGRPAMLTETHGQTSYVNYSNEVIEPNAVGRASVPLDMADPAADFERRFPMERDLLAGPDEPLEGSVRFIGRDQYGVEQVLDYAFTQRVGQNIRQLTPEQQAAILQPLADLFDEFPNLRVRHIDSVSFSEGLTEVGDADGLIGMGRPPHLAETWGADKNESVIIFNTDHFGKDFSPLTRMNEAGKSYPTFSKMDPLSGSYRETPRITNVGTPHNAGFLDEAQVARHEAGHAFDVARRPHKPKLDANGKHQFDVVKREYEFFQEAAGPEHQQYFDMIARLEKQAGRLDLSEYGMTNSPEFAAELFAFSTAPDLVVANIKSTELRAMVEEFQQYLKDSGEWVPRAPASASAGAGKTVRELNAAKRGTVYAPQKAGLLPQAYLDEFMEKFVGRGRNIESNPDVARAAQMFGKWTDGVIANGLLKGDRAIHGQLLQDIAGIPTGAAVPYNFTEGAAVNLATEAMKRKWDDAFRLQYFKQERSVLERSINHPMFGLYPASYMWGKIAPELVRFIAAEPFGHKTGGLLYTAMDVQAAIAMRREFDPTFDAKFEALGHSQAISFGGYLLPTLPWEVDAAAPGWMKSISEQGLSNRVAQEAGGTGEDISLLDPAVSVVKKLNPLEVSLPWAGRAVGELTSSEDKVVKATELGDPLQRAMKELSEALR